ncbi:MAG: hypothetical protein KDA85_04660, partial [Planctomycetaceae bacterium]|nr:hypothetical protein [Planctomycetaceae bacterium]
MIRFFSPSALSAARVPRREWLRLSSMTGFAAAAAPLSSGSRAAADELGTTRPPGFGEAKSVIVVFAS